MNATYPIGAFVPWYGEEKDIPEGWEILEAPVPVRLDLITFAMEAPEGGFIIIRRS